LFGPSNGGCDLPPLTAGQGFSCGQSDIPPGRVVSAA
jgi:hypothetical protein